MTDIRRSEAFTIAVSYDRDQDCYFVDEERPTRTGGRNTVRLADDLTLVSAISEVAWSLANEAGISPFDLNLNLAEPIHPQH